MNQTQRMVLTKGLLVIETNLHTIKDELESESGEFMLYSKTNNIDAERKKRILTYIKLMFNQIKSIKETYDLRSSEKRNLTGVVASHLIQIWETIGELGPKGMRGYGDMLKTDRDALNDNIDKLLVIHEKLLEEIKQVK